jgi:glycerol uptake facilitator protein
VIRSLASRAVAEALGTALLVGLGTGTIVAASRVGGIPLWEMSVAWFLAVLIPILLLIQLSGAHLNPAVTLSLAVSGRISWGEAPSYMVGQFAGALGGSALVLALATMPTPERPSRPKAISL